MTNQPTDNEWIEKARKQFVTEEYPPMDPNDKKYWDALWVTKNLFFKAILDNLPPRGFTGSYMKGDTISRTRRARKRISKVLCY